MTGSKVLVVKLPELHADVKTLEAFRAYVCDALGAGALVLPLGTTYAVEDFPALGAVEVVAGSAAPRSHALPMSEGEIVLSYRQAAKPKAQITVLADLNACSKECIEEILREAGEPLPKKAGRPKRTEGAHE